MKTRTLLFMLVAFGLLFVAGSIPATADLGGSNVTFAPEAGGDACYIPGRSQTFCFSAESITDDGEDVSTLFLHFPTGWLVSDDTPTVAGTPSCTGGGSFSGEVGWTPFGDSWMLTHARTQTGAETCTAVYCIELKAPAVVALAPDTSSTGASIDWSWYSGDTTTDPPHRPCSGAGWDDPLGEACDPSGIPAATVPICTHEELTILPETLPPATIGAPYSQQFTASGADGPYFWEWDADTPPSICELLSYTGEFNCYTSPMLPGNYALTIKVTGSGWSDGSRAYTLSVYEPLTFDLDNLAPGKAGEAYAQTITVANGTAPYAITSGDLPDGLTSSTDATAGTFTISGTPAAAGSSTVALTVTDANGASGAKEYTLFIAPERAFTWDPETPFEGDSATFTASPEPSDYGWLRGNDPGDTCFDDYSFLWGGNPKAISFGAAGTYQVCLQYWVSAIMQYVTDAQWVTVVNGPPDVYPNLYPGPSLVGQQVNGHAYIDDLGGGPFTCTVDWGDGSATETVVSPPGSDTCDFSLHTYTTAGLYTVSVDATDDAGLKGTGITEHEVVAVRAEYITDWLTSNEVPTTIELRGYAAAGTESLTFALADVLPQYGTLGTLDFVGCVPWISEEGPGAAADGAAAARAARDPAAAERGRPDAYPRAPYAPAAVTQAEGPVVCTATVVYTPTPPGEGEDPPFQDYFTFTVSDGTNTSQPGEVSLYIGTNSAPTAQDSSVTVRAGLASSIALTATDPNAYGGWLTDHMTFSIVSGPTNGTLGAPSRANCDTVCGEVSCTARCTSVVTYTPGAGATTDSFTFHVNDSHHDSNLATVSLAVHAPATLTVNATDDVDDGTCTVTHCSLREAVLYSLPGDTIEFALTLPATIELSHGQILIDHDLTISGPGADQLTISGGAPVPGPGEKPVYEGYERIFEFHNWASDGSLPVNATISGLTIRDGRSNEGGGFMVGPNSTVTVNDCVIGPNNFVTYAGGGIANEEGTLTLNRSTVVGNHGTGSEGGAGIYTAYGSTILANTTVSGNVTNNLGGGILVRYDGTVTLVHSTVSGNTANENFATEAWGGGGGIYATSGGRATLQNSIVAGNTDMTDPETAGHPKWPDVYGAFTSSGGNLVGDDTGSTGWGYNDLVGLDPMLDVLGLNAPGVTPTHALLEGSPAIDAAPTCAAETDQRGVARPQGDFCDSGAYELEQGDTTPPVLTITGATADDGPMGGDLETGYILPTTNDPAVDHLIQFASGTNASEPLADDYFGLYLTSSTVSPAALQAYYVRRDVPVPYLAYLISAAWGNNPFVYIKGSTVTLVDAAKHDIQGVDVDMTVPDDYPLGTYTVEGVIFDGAGNETTVTLILVVSGNRMTVQDVTVTSAKKGTRYSATAVATIIYADGSGVRVNKAVVDGEWRLGGTPIAVQATTGKKGTATFRGQSVSPGYDYQFCVTDVTKTGYSWQPGTNDCATFDVTPTP